MLKYPDGKLFRNSKGEAWTISAVNCAFIRLQQKCGKAIASERGLEPSEKEINEFARSLARCKGIKVEAVEKSESDLFIESRRKLRLREAKRLATKYSRYTLRHSWATHALERAADSLTVAVLIGHKDTSTLAKVYQHLAHNPEYLLEQARKAAG